MVTMRSSSSEVISPALRRIRLPNLSIRRRVCLDDGEHVPLVQIDIGFLADQIGVTTSDTLNLGQGVHDLLLAIDIGVEETEDELEIRLLS